MDSDTFAKSFKAMTIYRRCTCGTCASEVSDGLKDQAHYVTKVAYDALAAKYKALMDTKVEDFRLSAEADKARIAELQGIADARMARIEELEAALREIGRFCNVPDDSSAWSVFMMVPEDLRPAAETPASVSTTGTVRRSVRDMVVPRSEPETTPDFLKPQTPSSNPPTTGLPKTAYAAETGTEPSRANADRTEPWDCPKCGQRNSAHQRTCGRCEDL